ncbi:Oncosphere antigen A, partial [Taenia solium]
MSLHLCLVLLVSSIVHDELAQAIGMHKPIFEATYFEGLAEMLLHIQDPEGFDGVFGGFEVLMKTDDFNLPSSWRSLANLTASQRDYAIADPKPLTTYAVTVRGRLLPNRFSEMAEPVELTRLNPDLSVPQSVQLVAIDSHTVYMSWDPPIQSYGFVAGYTVLWYLDDVRHEYVTFTSGSFYVFTKLQPGQSMLASVRAESYPVSSMKLTYISTFTELVKVTTLLEEG